MSVGSSMYTAANGLQSHAQAMNVISDNIANLSTNGFKSSRAHFEDVIASTVGDAKQAALQGQGSEIGGASTDYSQGTLQPTGNATDLALQGNGFFVVNGSSNGAVGTFFTRNGAFGMNAGGTLTSLDGLAVQGYLVNQSGVLQTGLTDLTIGSTSLIPPNPTGSISMRANLDSRASSATAFNLQDPSDTSAFSTSVAVFDSRGNTHNVDVYFSATGNNQFAWNAVCAGADVAGGTKGTNVSVGNGTVTFNSNGTLETITPAQPNATVSFNNATPNQAITFEFGDPTSTGGTGLTGMTSYAGSSNITFVQQDGFAEGALVGITVADSGDINGAFTNGQSRLLGMVAVANFTNQQGLSRVGNTLLVTTLESGLPAIGPPGTGGRASISSGSLEQSNVNLSQEFIDLMTVQRGFEANTRSVKAADQIMQELVNLGR